jgi:hypothetical protein
MGAILTQWRFMHDEALWRKVLSTIKMVALVVKEALANSVPAAAVIQRVRALFVLIGCKG